MKKMTFFSATAATLIAFSYSHIEGNNTPPQIEHVGKKQSKNTRHIKVLTAEEFEQKKNIEVAKLNALIESTEKKIKEASHITEFHKTEANLILEAVKKWVATIKDFTDPTTHLPRSFKIAKSELDSVNATLKIREKKEVVNPKNEKKLAKNKARIEKEIMNLEAQLLEVEGSYSKLSFESDNKLFVLRMIENAKEYITFLKQNKEKIESFYLIKHTKKLLKKIHDFFKHPGHKVKSPKTKEVKAPEIKISEVKTEEKSHDAKADNKQDVSNEKISPAATTEAAA